MSPRSRSFRRAMTGRAVLVLGLAVIASIAGTLFRVGGVAPIEPVEPFRPRVSLRLPWHGSGVWLHGDIHTHRLLSSGPGPGIARRAVEAGLDFLASTDHAQGALREHEVVRLQELRRRFPELIVLAGLEWNVPSGDHAAVVVEHASREVEVLREFASRFDRKVNPQLKRLRNGRDHGTWGGIEQATDGLQWLVGLRSRTGIESAVYLNHISRHEYLSHEQIATLQAAGLSGIEAAPGHQKRERPGTVRTLDRHEPFVEVVGQGYDRLLARGQPLGLSAGSDFHHAGSSYYPGQFSRTLVYAPDRTSRGVVQGLRSSATATVLGGIVTAVETRTGCAGLEDHAGIGETLSVRVGTPLIYSLLLEVPEVDFEGRPNRLHEIEVISDFLGRPEVIRRVRRPGMGTLRVDTHLPPGATASPRTFYLRARGRRKVGSREHDRRNADYQFFTGATRVHVIGQAPRVGSNPLQDALSDPAGQ